MVVTAVAGAIGTVANVYPIIQGEYDVLNIVMLVSFLLICAFAVHPILTGHTE
jgi:hypothetical protein